jgi:hypothetical protein
MHSRVRVVADSDTLSAPPHTDLGAGGCPPAGRDRTPLTSTPSAGVSHAENSVLADAYSRFVSPIVGLVWVLIVSRVLLSRSPATRAGW